MIYKLILKEKTDIFKLKEIVTNSYNFDKYRISPEDDRTWEIVYNDIPLFYITTTICNTERHTMRPIKINDSLSSCFYFEKEVIIRNVERIGG